MRLDEVELLVAAGRATAYRVQESMAKIEEELQTSGATRLLTGIDICNTQIASSVIGIFSLYEARLQFTMGWTN